MTDAATLLSSHRESIDRLDAILVYTLGERFKHTQEVGRLKADHDLPPSDPVREAGVVIEPMDTGAAARTFNVLLMEERRVAAALLAV